MTRLGTSVQYSQCSVRTFIFWVRCADVVCGRCCVRPVTLSGAVTGSMREGVVESRELDFSEKPVLSMKDVSAVGAAPERGVSSEIRASSSRAVPTRSTLPSGMAEQLGVSFAAAGLSAETGLPAEKGGLLPGACVSSGFRELDKLLPAGGVRRGSLLEWLPAAVAVHETPPEWTPSKCLTSQPNIRTARAPSAARAQALQGVREGQTHQAAQADRSEQKAPGDQRARGRSNWNASEGGSLGSGVVTLAMATAVQVTRTAASEMGAAATVLVVDRSGWFYPPAVMRWLGADRWQVARGQVQLIVARPSRDDDEIWAIDQALRCAGVGAVVACPSQAVVCSKVMRRWQLAARASGAVGMFVRPWQCWRDPSWAEVRLVTSPLRASHHAEVSLRRWQIERLSSVLYGEGRSCELSLDLERGVEGLPAARWLPPRQQSLGGERSRRESACRTAGNEVVVLQTPGSLGQEGASGEAVGGVVRVSATPGDLSAGGAVSVRAALGSVVEGNAALGSVAGGRVVGSRDDSASVCFEQVLRKGKDGVACRAS